MWWFFDPWGLGGYKRFCFAAKAQKHEDSQRIITKS